MSELLEKLWFDVWEQNCRLADSESNLVRQLGRAEEVQGRSSDRLWIADEDWRRLRPMVAVIISIIKADDQVSSAENELLNDLVEELVSRTEWAETFTESKHRAILQLAQTMPSDTAEMEADATLCGMFLTTYELRPFVATLTRLAGSADVTTRQQIDAAISCLSEGRRLV